MTSKQLLSSNTYIQYPKFLGCLIGVNEAVLLTMLCDTDSKCETDIDEYDGWFYCTRETIYIETGLTENQQRTALKSLIELNIVQTKKQGIPALLYYFINENTLQQVLDKAFNLYKVRRQQTSKKCSTRTDENDTSCTIENNNHTIYNNKEKELNKKAPEPVPSEIKSSKRNFRRETEPLKDVLESGADIKKQVDSQKKKKTTKEKCLDEIEETKYGFTDDEKEVLREYLEWAVSGRDNRRIKNVDLWRNKLNTLIQLRDDGEDITKVVQNSLEKKWYVFVEEKQNHSNSSSHYVQKVDRIVNTKSNFNSKEEVEAELKRRVEVGIPSFK